MIIGKKSFVTPSQPDLSGDERIERIFRDRKLLHEHSIPSFAVYIDESAWNAFLQKANDEYTKRGNEASGIILGKYLKDNFGEYVVGTHYEAGNGSGTSAVFCEISIQDQLRIIQSAKEKTLLQVIWIHSHPTFGAFYSTVDYRTLKSMYYAPHQAGIVVDNVKGEYLGFKVRNGNANEFKEIFLFRLDDAESLASQPFGKDPVKVFYAKNNSSFSSNRKVNDPVSLKSAGKGKKQVHSAEVLSLITKAADDLKLILSGPDETNDRTNQYVHDWEIKIKEIEGMLYEQYGEKPYKDVVPCVNILNEMSVLINEKYSSASHAKLRDKLNELLKSLPE
jgi:proteasome lid subunit RPN8/RPN11